MSGSLDRELGKGLAKAVRAARQVAEAGARAALGGLQVGAGASDRSMSEEKKELRRRLRAHGRALGDQRRGAEQETARLAHEVAYEHWHRMLFARFLAENDLLIEPESGETVSFDECREFARERGEDPWEMASVFAQAMLPRIFRRDDPALAVRLAPETQQALEKILGELPPAVFRADDALGWTYQFWQSDRKDEVNRSGVKIGADELPAVTQLFTERYMVRFLFHNTVGAWRAGKILARNSDLATGAGSEDGLRREVRIDTVGGYDFDYLRFVREPAEGGEEAGAGRWRPAAGAFAKWPRRAADLKALDPCCGSGHFLVEGLHLFVRLRMEEEQLSAEDAVCAVLRDNLHGLELDPRCAQLAAFAVALAAWKLAGRVIELPPLNIACSGLAPNATKAEWVALALQDPPAAARADLYGRRVFAQRESLLSSGQRHTLGALHDLFREAPTLGSLVDPRAAGGMFAERFESVQPFLERVLAAGERDPEFRERAVAAAGMARAATLLAGTYEIVITNVPYLARGKQDEALRAFAEDHYPAAKGDLATMFVARAFGWLGQHGTQALVVPQNWLFLTTYKKLRVDLLTGRWWNLVVRLGSKAFQTSMWDFNTALTVLSAEHPGNRAQFAGLDVSASHGQAPIPAPEKARLLRASEIRRMKQQSSLISPDSRILFVASEVTNWLFHVASYSRGICTGDDLSFCRLFWELPDVDAAVWSWQQTTNSKIEHYAGYRRVLRWENGEGALVTAVEARLGELVGQWIRGRRVWGQEGVLVSPTGEIKCCLYQGHHFDANSLVVVPRDPELASSLWVYCASSEYAHDVREVDSALKVGDAVVKVPFDPARWKAIAAEKYPNGLPEPYTDDPTQWIFHGHPCASVIWDPEAKRTAEGPLRTDATVLQVAVARLLGYRWPAERDPDMHLAPEARTMVKRCDSLLSLADEGGIVCLPALRGEAPAADRLRSLLAAAHGDAWSSATEQRLLHEAAEGKRPAATLDDWLGNHFFDAHCRLFQHRPFLWHVWDGLRDGFSALVNYHRLAGPGGDGRRTLESLTYSYLGDWIERQRAGQQQEVPGADARLEAALELQSRLGAILTAEPPLDLFVRWKPLHEQPIGWDPDINDGVRLNIRPFLRAELRKGGKKGAGILRWKPNIKWTKDRGKEPQHLKPKRKGDPPEPYRPKADFPWFWFCPGDGPATGRTDFQGRPQFDGARWNDLHYTTAAKREARRRAQRDA